MNLSWLFGADRKICPTAGLLFLPSLGKASWCQTVTLGQIFLSAPHTRGRFLYLYSMVICGMLNGNCHLGPTSIYILCIILVISIFVLETKIPEKKALLLNDYISLVDEPYPPGQPQVKDQNRDHITIKWEPPENDGGAPITGYEVERKEPKSNRWSKITRYELFQCL